MTSRTKEKAAAETASGDYFDPSVDHHAAMNEELRADPRYAELILQTALDEIYEEGGIPAFLIALRQVIEARGGITEIAKKSGLARQHIYRALSENGNPTLTTLTAITRAAGIRLSSGRR